MNIYLAARYDQHPLMRFYATKLEPLGYRVTSRWINQHDGEAGDGCTVEDINQRPEYAAQFARKDVADVLRSEVLVAFTCWPSSTGGRHVELGLALGRGLIVHVVGPRENIFQALDGDFITYHPTLQAFERAFGIEEKA